MPQPAPIVYSHESHARTLQHLRQLSYLLDNAFSIPGTPFRVGMDAIVGLLPFGGDIVIGIFSIYIVVRAARLGLPRATLVRMVLNILLDVVVGSIPLLGDLFDATWKCNTKNVALLESHLQSPRAGKKADMRFLFLILTGLIVTAIAAVVLIGTLVFLIVRAMSNF
ncbi:MAG: DUF4112 domain-containing protein [Actinomycetota bacterium]